MNFGNVYACIQPWQPKSPSVKGAQGGKGWMNTSQHSTAPHRFPCHAAEQKDSQIFPTVFCREKMISCPFMF